MLLNKTGQFFSLFFIPFWMSDANITQNTMFSVKFDSVTRVGGGGGGIQANVRTTDKRFSSLHKESSFVNKIDRRPVNFENIAFVVNTIRLYFTQYLHN